MNGRAFARADRFIREVHGLAVEVQRGPDNDQRARLLADWLGPDGQAAGERLIKLAATAPAMAAGYVRTLTNARTDAGRMWALDPAEIRADDPTRVAVARALTYVLNDDLDGAADVVRAHQAVHGVRGLAAFGVDSLILLGGLIEETRRRHARPARRRGWWKRGAR